MRAGAPLAAALVLGGGCKARNDASDVKVTNGIDILTPADDPYPAVVQITNTQTKNVCTATFITTRVLLTAAHCLSDKPNGAIAYGQTAAVAAVHLGLTGMAAEINPRDLALVDLGADLAPAVQPLYGKPVAAGDAVTFVGFGLGDLFDPGTLGTKRYGSNTVAGFDNGLILVLGATGPADGSGSPDTPPAGSDSASALGDSGGPLLINGGVAATVSGGSENTDHQKRSVCVDVASAPGQELFAKAAAQGLSLPGAVPAPSGP